MNAEIEAKQPADKGDSQAGGITPARNPFDDVLREAFGRPSTGTNDDASGVPGSKGDGTTTSLNGAGPIGAGAENNQLATAAGAGEQFLDMETGQIVGATTEETRGAAAGAETVSGNKERESAKHPAPAKPATDAANPNGSSKKADATAKETDLSEEGEDFAVFRKPIPKTPVDGAAKPAGTEKAPAVGPSETDGKKKPETDVAEKQKADDAEKKKTPELPNYKPEPSRNRRHDTSMEKMTGWLNKNFDAIDADKNGTVTKDELGKQMENPALANGEGGIYLATAYGAADNWKNVANELTGKKPDDKGTEPKKDKAQDPNLGITRDDIKAVRDNLDKFDSKESKDQHTIKSVSQDFPNLDTNNDKTITEAELDNALKEDGLGKEQREKLETLKRNFKEVAGTTDDIIKRKHESGQDADPEIQKPTLDGKPLKDVEFISEHDLNTFKGSEAVSLDKSLESHTKHLSSDLPVTQGQTGSCFVLAPVAAILEKDPKFFDDKIKDLGDGKLQVTLPEDEDGRQGTVKTVINKPTDAERARFGGGETAAIIEKAFSQHYKDLYASKKPGAVQDEVHDGGNEHRAIRSLTGRGSKRTSPDEAEDKVQGELNHSNDANKAVTAGTNKEVSSASGLLPRHVYHVSGFDKATGEVELTNPHKGDFGGTIEPIKRDGSPRDGKLDGKFKISFAEFKDHFAEINSFDIRKK
ncbi:MAG: hypothetical protein SGJ27_17205 [Candidatus Melainabacteria bacterium]|nr:hypothetical protein [Candidatus Melainabacteria bacterium]